MGDLRESEVNSLLERIEAIIEDGRPSFLSNKISVDKEEMLALLQDLRIKLPIEFQQSSQIVTERNKILAQAQSDSNLMMEEAQETLQKMIDQHEVTKYAESRAQAIIEAARRDARQVHLGAIDYADDTIKSVEQRLKLMLNAVHQETAEFENYVSDVLRTLYEHRQELKGVVNQQLVLPDLEDNA